MYIETKRKTFEEKISLLSLEKSTQGKLKLIFILPMFVERAAESNIFMFYFSSFLQNEVKYVNFPSRGFTYVTRKTHARFYPFF